MLFSSMLFLWLFLPLVLLLNFLIKNIRLKNIMLLFASLLFYAWGEPVNVILLIISIFINWLGGLLLVKYESGKKLILFLCVVLNLSILGYFKYANFFLNTIDKLLPFVSLPRVNIALPIGISFFTFQAMSYVIDLYRKKINVQKNIFDLALYISFFPQLIAGPIVKYRDIDKQILSRTVSFTDTAEGFRRFIYGLGKKVVVSNVLAQTSDLVFALEADKLTTLSAWIGAVFFSLQIYYDFSGYSDMAIGLGKMFGFNFNENFIYPYISSSIKEFWRRWHISLSSWFKEYLYIPIGGNRNGNVRTYINLLIVFMATGLWHGASWSFVGWGLYHGFFLVIERLGFGKMLEKTRLFKHIYAVIVVMIGWILFNARSLSFGLGMIKCLFVPTQGNGVMTFPVILSTLGISALTIFVLIIAIIGCGPLQLIFSKKGFEAVGGKWKGSAAEAVFAAAMLIYCIVLLANNTYNPFIYFRF